MNSQRNLSPPTVMTHMLSYLQQYAQKSNLKQNRLLSICVCSFLLSACHIVSSPELLDIEAENDSDQEKKTYEWEKQDNACSLEHLSQHKRSSFVAWWEGEWVIDQEHLAKHLAQAMSSQGDANELLMISQSLSSAFKLKIQSQQAQLLVDGKTYRLATTPVRSDQGVRLIGGQRDMTIWCQKDQVLWRAESGESFPLRFVK